MTAQPLAPRACAALLVLTLLCLPLQGQAQARGPHPPAVVSIKKLPRGFATVVVRGTTYFLAGGVYYRPAPAGYLVVADPTAGNLATCGQVVVEAAALNLRAGPGVDHPVLWQVARGERLGVEGEAPGWYYVRTPGGLHGWVMAAFTRPVSQG